MLLTTTAHGTTFTVGPSGQYASLPAALQAVQAAGAGMHEVRVQTGSYTLTGPLNWQSQAGVSLDISGGWNAQFTSSTQDRNQTVLVATEGRALSLLGSGGRFSLRAFRILSGQTGAQAAVSSEVFGGALRIENLTVIGAEADNFVAGCVQINAYESAQVWLDDLFLSGCRTSWQATVGASALRLSLRDQAVAVVQRLTAVDNTFDASASFGQRVTAAIAITADEQAQLSLTDIEVHRNRVLCSGSNLRLTTGLFLSSPYFGESSEALMTARRLNVSDNSCASSSNTVQVTVNAFSNLSTTVSDFLIHNAPGRGLTIAGGFDSTGTFVNGTVTRHGEFGISMSGESENAQLTLANTIIVGNGPPGLGRDLVVSTLFPQFAPTLITNSIGTDPLFVGPTDFRLRPDSPLIDAGTAVAGLGPLDLSGAPRVNNFVDIGAYESPEVNRLFTNGFE